MSEIVGSNDAVAVTHAEVKPKKTKKKSGKEGFLSVGRRKTAIARVHLFPGKGDISINGKPYNEYVSNRIRLMFEIEKPFKVINVLNKYSVIVSTLGGGIAAQADAVKLGIARALIQMDPAMKPALSKAGCLVRDPREKERKKYGQKKARKRFQYSKR